MSGWKEKAHFWLPFGLLALGACGLCARLVMLHLDLVKSKPTPNNYTFTHDVLALRGPICGAAGPEYPLACSVKIWEYRLDPQSINLKRSSFVDKTKPFTYTEASRIISDQLGIPLLKVMDAYAKRGAGSRNTLLSSSMDSSVHTALVSKAADLGLKIEEKNIRRYPQGRRLSHVLGFVTLDPVASVGNAGIEMRYETLLKGRPGRVKGTRTALGKEVRIKRGVDVDPQTGCMVKLTIDHNLQYVVERELAAGVVSNGAEAAWCVVLAAKTGAVLAMASLPDYEPEHFNKYPKENQRNNAISINYEPGSVMKCITACAALNERIAGPDTLINTAHNDPRYYRLPTDHGHKWDAFMTVRDAIVHSSNIVFGKLGVDLGPKRLRKYMEEFGIGQKTGIQLPGEERGELPPLEKWDKVKWSRAPIGQGISVTGIQLAAAYGAIANDGELLRPYIVESVTDADGVEIEHHEKEVVGHPCRPEVARSVRQMMLGVAKKGGTARRAAVRGYTVAGKTGTAQIPYPRVGYSGTDYHASFVGIIPASRPELVILVTYRKPAFCRRRGERYEIFNHQGGTCAAPTFRRIAEYAMRYLEVEPDLPDEIPDEDD